MRRGILSPLTMMSGLALLEAGSITQDIFRRMPKYEKGRRPKARSKYIPAGPRRNCGHGFRGMKRIEA